MSSYKDTILTQRGSSIASDAAKGKLQFTITRTVASNADFSNYNDDNLAALTKLPNEIQNGSIVDELDDTDQQGTTGTQVRFTNTNVKTAFKINAVGLYAKINGDDTEYLYSITLADSPYYMNDYSNKVYNQFDLIIYVVVGDKANLNLNINPDSFVSYGYLQKRLDLKADKVDLDKKADKSDLARIDLSSATKDANKYTDDNAMLIARDETVTGIKDFSKGFKLNGKNLGLQDDKLFFDGKPLLTANAPNVPKLSISVNKDTGNVDYQITPPVIDGGASIIKYILSYYISETNSWKDLELSTNDLTGEVTLDKNKNYETHFKVCAVNYAGNSDYDEKKLTLKTIPNKPIFNIEWNSNFDLIININKDNDTTRTVDYYLINYSINGTDWHSIKSSENLINIGKTSSEPKISLSVTAVNGRGMSEKSEESISRNFKAEMYNYLNDNVLIKGFTDPNNYTWKVLLKQSNLINNLVKKINIYSFQTSSGVQYQANQLNGIKQSIINHSDMASAITRSFQIFVINSNISENILNWNDKWIHNSSYIMHAFATATLQDGSEIILEKTLVTN
ncbi:fibronectin type III domain-containing protein [Apilactobacillus xinyiensis]|uniref:fibronectin type III domain-containing protein n=1 Tax=Apilactobacillus xinyiensis TaxID=2841032 RepID=UPI002010B8BE|nr:fibronectin type III domain-containing protein [Apilactobacillus xinyiensis]MCL0319393.1 fibronectin type III domain-containing protein [Apilactobacillus xinyiensis]